MPGHWCWKAQSTSNIWLSKKWQWINQGQGMKMKKPCWVSAAIHQRGGLLPQARNRPQVTPPFMSRHMSVIVGRYCIVYGMSGQAWALVSSYYVPQFQSCCHACSDGSHYAAQQLAYSKRVAPILSGAQWLSRSWSLHMGCLDPRAARRRRGLYLRHYCISRQNP